MKQNYQNCSVQATGLCRMWRVVCVLVCLTLSMSALANPITREQAQQKAEKFLKTRKGSYMLSPVTNNKKLAPRRAGDISPTSLYYVFNRGMQEGYVIVAGDDQFETVLGYTDAGEFDYQAIPDNMRYWLDCYATYIERLQSTPNAVRAKLPTHPAIPEMLTCRWDQGSPYNDECPMYFNYGRSVTGCVATAMAQILYFQRAKSVTETQADIPAYTTWNADESLRLPVAGIPAGSPLDWDNMRDTYNNSSTAKQKQAVAQLMHYCGVSVEMDYTNSASGAQSWKVAGAMNNYFGYSTATYIQRDNYSDTSWDAVIYNELDQGRVVYLSGANPNADMGHAFVCDGYDGNQCFHINWGWGGQSNGFFLLSSLDPAVQGIGGSSSGGGYNAYQDAVIRCEPDNFTEKEMPISNATAKTLCVSNWDFDGDGKFTFGEAAQVTDLGTVFQGQNIATFPELYNFTSLTAIPDSAFYGCSRLMTIKLPKSVKTIGAHAFDDCRTLKAFKLPDGLTAIGKAAFAGCRVITSPTLPQALAEIPDSTFAGCVAITEIDLPLPVMSIGKNAFAGCTKLATFNVKSLTPQNIQLGEGVFSNVNLADAQLNVLQGTKAFFSTAEQWSDFGTIYEERTLSRGKFAELATNQSFFLYNEGTGRYLSYGESWGTQAVVGTEPMRFQLRRSNSMPEGVYYIFAQNTSFDGKVLFRTYTDSNVGTGVAACYVDGDNSHITDKTSYWSIQSVGDCLYTFQIPADGSHYDASQFWGVQTDHASNAATPTYGVYSDISYADYPLNCQWRFVAYDEQQLKTFEAADVLGNLLAKASGKHFDYSFEQAVYDDTESTYEQIVAAQHTMRKKLDIIEFKDPVLRQVALDCWDFDSDGEITYAEAARVEDFGYFSFWNKQFTNLEDLQYFTNGAYIQSASFADNTKLQSVKLPESLTHIYYNSFTNCKLLKSIELPSPISHIGSSCFSGCTGLTSVTVLNPDPASIELQDGVFKNVKLANVTLYVPFGSKELYAAAPVWQDFGNIVEVRGKYRLHYSPVEPNVKGYIINLAEQKYITSGEAYGTQAVVGNNGLQYEFRRTNSMPEGQYYLSSSAGVLFRTSKDSKVGEGVKACFVDGNAGATAYWTLVQDEETNTFTLQVPAADATYTEGEFLGTNTSHASNYTYTTYGLYWDVTPNESGKNVQWAFISLDEIQFAQDFDKLAAKLKNLLAAAAELDIDATEEKAVYDNPESLYSEIEQAVQTLSQKLGYIQFADSNAKTICVNNWDADDDGELSIAEAAAVTNIGSVFHSMTNVKSLEELRYFTSLTELPDEAFRSCTNLTSLYIPSGITSIGQKAFTSCTSLKYVASLTPAVVDVTETALPRSVTVFVPAELIEAYQADETWGRATIVEYTGIPVITANDVSRQYGRSNPKFTYTLSGAPINGEPVLEAEQVVIPDSDGELYTEQTRPAGTYPIVVLRNLITSPNLQCVDGTLTVEKAPLTITAKSYTRDRGEENPEFEVTYKVFRNREKAATALTVQPTIECDATPDSPRGTYEIRVYGAEAPNYEITYVNGTLTVEGPVAIEGIAADGNSQPLYDLQGRRVSTPTRRGIYLKGNKKVLVK